MLTVLSDKLKKFFYQQRKKILWGFIGIFALTIIIPVLFYLNSTHKAKEHNKIITASGIVIPEDLNFSGETLPLNNPEVIAGLEKEFTNFLQRKTHILPMHRRSNRWFPVIEPILKKHQIPDDFKYLAVIESNLTNIVSPVGAVGYWQLMQTTAEQYGLTINEDVDERYHIIKSTEAACKYFKEAYKTFENWTLVAASYNLGMNGIANRLEKQNVSNFYELNLNSETTRFIYKILVIKQVIAEPLAYGFDFKRKELYNPIRYKTITIDSTISNLHTFCNQLQIPYNLFKIFNPWLRSEKLNNSSNKKYTLYIPFKEQLGYSYSEESTGATLDTTITKAINDSLIKPSDTILQ